MPSTADVFLRLRVDPAQVKKDVDEGLKGVDTSAAGKRAGDDFGLNFSKTVTPKVAGAYEDIGKRGEVAMGASGGRAADSFGNELNKRASGHGQTFAEKLAGGVNIKRDLILGAITAALAVGPAAIAGAGAALGVGFAAAAGLAIYKSLSTNLKTATTELTKVTAEHAKAVKDLAAAEKSGNAAAIANAQAQLDASNKAVAAAQKNVNAVKAQLAPYDQIKGALKNLKDTLVDVGSKALQNSGILGVFTAAIKDVGTWLEANRDKFTAFFAAAAPYVPIFAHWFEDLTGRLLPILTRLLNEAVPAVAKMLAAFNGFVSSGVGGFLAQVGKSAGTSAQAFGILLRQIAPLLPLIGALAGIAARLIVAFPPLVPVILSLSVALKALLIISTVIAAFTKIAEATKAIQEFNIVSKLAFLTNPWVLLGVAVVAAVVLIIKYWGPISQFFIKIWNDIYSGFIKPVINFFTQTIPHAFQVTIDWLKHNWPLIVLIFVSPLLAIVLLAIKFRHDIGQAFTDAWNEVFKFTKAIWGQIAAYFTGQLNALKAVLSAAWNAIKAVVLAEWNLLKAFFTQWWQIVSALFTGNTTVLKEKLQAVWTAIRTVAVGIWNLIKSDWNVFWGALNSVVFSAAGKITALLGTFWGAIKTGFQVAVAAVKTVWDTLESIAANPVRFIIGTVYNKGIVPVVDAIAGVVGLHPLNAIAGFAAGGLVSRGTGETADDVLVRVSRNETIVSAAHSRVLAPAFAAVGVPGYAAGGVPNTGGRAFAAAGPAATISGPALGPLQGIVSAAISGLRALVGDALGAGINAVLNPLLNAIPGLNTGFGQYVKGDITKVTSDLVNFIKGKSLATSSPVPNVGAGTARWKGIVDQALKLLGLSTSLDARVLYQMQTESGGNPNAINLTDINAKNGDPSRGLLQVIMSTFQAYHVAGTSSNIYDPLANVAAAINYARARYGPTLMSNGQGIGSGHGYANGGWVREPVYGIGASGPYTFAEHGPEYVMSGNDMATVIGLLRALNATAAATPAATGRHVSGAINGVGAQAAYRDRYPMVR